MERITENVYELPVKDGIERILTDESPTHTISETKEGIFDLKYAVDIIADSGVAVYAAGPGKVVRIHTSIDSTSVDSNYRDLNDREGAIKHLGEENLGGNFVVIEHETPSGKKEYSVYGHLSQVDVKIDDEVSANTQIGLLGDTGWSACPHIHHWIFRREGSTRLSLRIRLLYQGKKTNYDKLKSQFSNIKN